MTIFESLTPVEKRLTGAFTRGEWLDLRQARDRVVRAAVVRGLLLGAVPAGDGYAPAIRLRGARVTGRLDLMGAVTEYPLILEHCRLEEEVRLVEAATRTVRIVHSRLTSLNGARLRLEGLLNLFGSTVAKGVRLERAKVTGEIYLRDAVLGADAGGVALAAEGLAVDGQFTATGLTARGTLMLRGLRVSGSLGLADARVTGAGTMAVDAEASVVDGQLHAERLRTEGELRLRHARIGASLQLVGARLINPTGCALSAGGMAVTGGTWCVAPFTASGEVRLIGARLGANLSFKGATLGNDNGAALTLDHAVVEGGVIGDDATLSGGHLSMRHAALNGGLTLRRARLPAAKDGGPLRMEGAAVEGLAAFDDVHAEGGVYIRDCRFGGPVIFAGARLEAPDGAALRFVRNEAAGRVLCERMTARGEVRFEHSRIGHDLDLREAVLSTPDGTALDATGLQAAELALLSRETHGRIVLDHARIGLLRDDPERWARALHVNGLTYEALEPRLPAESRLGWLRRDGRGYQPQPYEQLAAHYTGNGHLADARAVMFAKERAQRAGKTVLGRLWSGLQEVTVGFGYKPGRAALWLAVLVAAGAVVYGAAHPAPLKKGEAPDFNPVMYTLDLLLPFVDLGQQNAYNPTGGAQWFSYCLVAAGWILATTIARGVARVIGRG
ncbi:hypothetical protein [Sphaerisporangium krabiense]|uniref:Membrane-associated oxidoreductase n=1 Tax=Sphaerisporangium krabiense TaxID=763782 RepID=A0A7W8Z9G8_9ACTN|nr:hypothetical protein [Sphaerisporangium krabiense]MBB5629853.1 hypothetical protein [Sphaerisporangium krabiense]